ncbi:MAG TPA: NAD(P)/FAD-dependent oxidoreductase [Bradyrhizobium sp.]|nr:NAD(P)/FAD-dependent oxidoreductase [Bradyrhizobium sp.]
MAANVSVAIIGAGPYGLSISAHLTSRGVPHRIIGGAMEFWRAQMPKGMLLKSEGFASSLADPAGNLTLGRYCAEHNIAYADLGIPVSLETFCAYGLSFQRQLVPHLEDQKLVRLSSSAEGFVLQLRNGEEFTARNVVLAVGVSHFRYIPPELADLPPDCVTHSSEHSDPKRFRGREVTVIGAGSSAVDLATSLLESGAKVQLISRRPSIEIHGKMALPRPLRDKIRRPMSAIGQGWPLMAFCYLPSLIHHLPASFRVLSVERILGPAGGWFMKDRFAPVPILPGQTVKRAWASDAGVNLQIAGCDGVERSLVTEHVIAATGYKTDLNRLPFLSPDIRSRLDMIGSAPVLSSNFESSMRGLYFVGAAAAISFGPLMRFAAGAKFAARRVSRHLAAKSVVSRVPRASTNVSVSLHQGEGAG